MSNSQKYNDHHRELSISGRDEPTGLKLSHKNLFLHNALTDQGAFIHTHVEADFDDGDCENGPSSGGHDAYDLYEGESHDIVVDRSGLIVHMGLINWDEVRYFEGMQ